MKKFLSIALAAAMLVALAACGQSGTTSSSTAASSAAAKPTLKVAMEISYPPMEYIDEVDGVTEKGFDVDVAKALGEKLGMKIELQNAEFDTILDGLDADRYDCVISAVSSTDERNEAYNHTTPYINNKICLVAAASSSIKAPSELANKKVGVQKGTTSDDYITELNKTTKLTPSRYPSIVDAFTDIKAGRLDAVVSDNVVAQYYIGKDSASFKVVWESDEAEPMAIYLKKGNDDLTAKIQAAIDEMYADGTMAAIAKTHFGENANVSVK